jgi:hypothetical protein
LEGRPETTPFLFDKMQEISQRDQAGVALLAGGEFLAEILAAAGRLHLGVDRKGPQSGRKEMRAAAVHLGDQDLTLPQPKFSDGSG